MHGYELKKRLAELLGLTSGVSFGSLYPALARLESEGAAQVLTSPPGAAALTAWPGKAARRRKIYAITAAGLSLLERLLANFPADALDDRSFNIWFAFAGYLPAEDRLRVLERRHTALSERLALLARRAGQRRGERYVELLSERERDRLTREVSWLGRLIQDERQGTPEPPGAPGGSPARQSVPLASASQLSARRPIAAPAGS